jgi:Raf kinase inhibitor-like YbhB/YbcL family protein
VKRIACVLFLVACKSPGGGPSPPPGQTASEVAVTSSFAAGGSIPVSDTCDGTDQSPQLNWSAMPDKVKTIAIVVEDPDAPSGTFTHWILWNVKGDTRLIGANGNGGYSGGIGGTNDFDRPGYSGPCPPKGTLHHYHFHVYGLDTTLTLKQSDKRADLDHAMSGHVIAKGDLVGTFQH